MSQSHLNPLYRAGAVFTAFVAMLFTLSGTAVQAEERIAIPIDHREITNDGDVETLQLRGMIKRMRGEVDRERYELAWVAVMAKSRRDNSRLWLGIDQVEGERVRLDGNVNDFDDRDIETYTRIRLPVPSPKDHSGHWALNIKGPVKLRRLIIGLNDCGKGECRVQQVETRRIIPLEDSEVRVPSDSRVIDVRRLVERYDGNISLREASLVKVEVLTKIFERDGAVVRLDTENQKAVRTQMTGNRRNYRNPDADSFTLVELSPRDVSSTKGKWDLTLRKGTFRVREIAVTTVDRAFWRSNGAALPPPSEEEKKEDEEDGRDPKRQAKKNNCNRNNCKPSRKVKSRASGPRSCYASGDGRQIDRRDGATMSIVQGCSDGTCMKRSETCYESRTCKCADGSGRCTDTSSCSGGCKHGYVSLKFHCPSGVFDG